jgi:hypothetical protein
MKFPIAQYGLNFRLVVEEDAQFILSLRTDKKLARFISFTDNSLENQVRWIRNYKQREADGKEYYVIFENADKNPLGTFRLYDIKDDSFIAGSWLVRPDADEFAAIKSDLFLLNFSFEYLKMKTCFIDMRKENKKLVRYHKMFYKQYNEDEHNLYMVMDIDAYKKKRGYLTNILNS